MFLHISFWKFEKKKKRKNISEDFAYSLITIQNWTFIFCPSGSLNRIFYHFVESYKVDI